MCKFRQRRHNIDSNTKGFWKSGVRFERPHTWRVQVGLCALIAMMNPAPGRSAEPSLAIVGAGIQQSEDAPFVSEDFHFMPGDTLYFTFQISGFQVKASQSGEIRRISLTFEAAAQDRNGMPLAEPEAGEIKVELSPEDKNWTPKRRVSFVLPSAIGAGEFRVRLTVKDLLAGTEASDDFPFRIGGLAITPSGSIRVDSFSFVRGENDRAPLEVAAYRPGDSVYARFEMVGFKTGASKDYRLAYGITVLRPDGKPFINEPNAANLTADSFYPAQYVPGVLSLKTEANTPRGEYVLILTVHDEIAKTSFEVKRAFSLE